MKLNNDQCYKTLSILNKVDNHFKFNRYWTFDEKKQLFICHDGFNQELMSFEPITFNLQEMAKHLTHFNFKIIKITKDEKKVVKSFLKLLK